MLTVSILIPVWIFLLLLIVTPISLGFWIGNMDYVARLKRENEFAFKQIARYSDTVDELERQLALKASVYTAEEQEADRKKLLAYDFEREM